MSHLDNKYKEIEISKNGQFGQYIVNLISETLKNENPFKDAEDEWIIMKITDSFENNIDPNEFKVFSGDILKFANVAAQLLNDHGFNVEEKVDNTNSNNEIHLAKSKGICYPPFVTHVDNHGGAKFNMCTLIIYNCNCQHAGLNIYNDSVKIAKYNGVGMDNNYTSDQLHLYKFVSGEPSNPDKLKCIMFEGDLYHGGAAAL